MSESKTENKVGDRLQRIANVLLLNASFTDNIGLLNGKMGISIFFYNYAKYTGNKIFEDYAGELIDEIYEEINKNTPTDFVNGLTGIGWGIEYLVKNGFVVADTDEALAEIDNAVYRSSLYRPFLLNSANDLFGYGLYYIVRLREHENDDDNLNTLFKKQHLIYLTDDCERILVQKQFADYKVESLSTDTINSLLWFLLEMLRLGLFPVKIEKILHSVPEYIETCLQRTDDEPAKSLSIILAEKIISKAVDKNVQKIIKTIISINEPDTPVDEVNEDKMVNDFIKSNWQQLVYEPYITTSENLIKYPLEKIFSIIDSEVNWNRRLDQLNKDNMGLMGLAGLGMGLLCGVGRMGQGLEGNKKAKDKSHKTIELSTS